VVPLLVCLTLESLLWRRRVFLACPEHERADGVLSIGFARLPRGTHLVYRHAALGQPRRDDLCSGDGVAAAALYTLVEFFERGPYRAFTRPVKADDAGRGRQRGSGGGRFIPNDYAAVILCLCFFFKYWFFF
jgi:hypothetical protein